MPRISNNGDLWSSLSHISANLLYLYIIDVRVGKFILIPSSNETTPMPLKKYESIAVALFLAVRVSSTLVAGSDAATTMRAARNRATTTLSYFFWAIDVISIEFGVG